MRNKLSFTHQWGFHQSLFHNLMLAPLNIQLVVHFFFEIGERLEPNYHTLWRVEFRGETRVLLPMAKSVLL